jgi:ArsR family transcriptional regulator
MVNVKTFSPEKIEAAAFILKTIGHPTRIAIIDLLNRENELTVNDICEKLNTDQSLTSHHLSNMKLKGILGRRRSGRNVYYFIKMAEVVRVIDCISDCNIEF